MVKHRCLPALAALVFVGLILVATGAWAAAVTTNVDRDEVGPGESIVVTYEADQNVGQPDFTPLEKDFDIVDQNQSQSISVVNGRTSYQSKWNVVLMPKGTGEVTLPPIHFGSALSETRTIKVLGKSAKSTGKGDVDIDYGVDDPTPYVNQQVVLTTKVYTTMDVDNLDISTPRVVGGRGSIEKLGRVRVYHTVHASRDSTVHEQRYTLVPRSPGKLRLSPVVVHGTAKGTPVNGRTQALELQVLPQAGSGAAPSTHLEPGDLFLEAEVDKSSPYVQEQVLYTVRLFRAVAIENAALSAPSVSGGDAVIQRIGQDRRYQTSRNGRSYQVTQRRFVVFPQTSGGLTIVPVNLQAALPLPYTGGLNGFWSQPLTKPVRVQSKPIALTVKEPPAGAPDPWLPAHHVSLEEDWPKDDTVKVGTPITRHILVNAQGLLASQIPDFDLSLPDGLKIYPENPQRHDTSGDRGVTGRLEQTVAIIPSKPGTFTIPSIELDWWNTGTDSEEQLHLPAHVLHVIANSAVSPPVQSSSAPVAGTPTKTSIPAPAPASRTGWWISAALAVLWLSTLLLWWWDRRRAVSLRPAEDPGAHEVSRRRAEKELREACRAGEPRAARDALLDWARVCWPERSPRSLGTLGGLVDDTLAAEISTLQQALYAPDHAPWHGEGLHRAVAAFKVLPSGAAHGVNTLKPLYEH
jgi:hypothetical protein